jgi:hypothetical protein
MARAHNKSLPLLHQIDRAGVVHRQKSGAGAQAQLLKISQAVSNYRLIAFNGGA